MHIYIYVQTEAGLVLMNNIYIFNFKQQLKVWTKDVVTKSCRFIC